MSHRRSVHDLKSLVLSFHSVIAIETVEEERVKSILGEVAVDLRLPYYEWSLTTGLRRARTPIATTGTHDALSALRRIEEIGHEDAIYLMKDLGSHLTNPNVARVFRDLAQKLTSSRSAIVLTGDPIELPRDIDSVTVRFHLELPDPSELKDLLRNVVDSMGHRQRIQIDLNGEDVQRLIQAMAGLTLNQARQAIAHAIVVDDRLSADDIARIIRSKGELIHREGILEFFPLEENQFQLGGFGRLKAWLERARIGFSKEARAMNLSPPKGVLIVGVQGCGKSLAAKFIAREWQMPLLKLDAGRLYDKYVGESEKNFRKATALVEAMAPAVLWIDEIEKAFAQAGSHDADGGLSTRLFASFLTWLQEKKQEVFVVGAANDLTRLPPEMLRKGRFDEIFFVDLPGAEERKSIFTIHLSLRKQDPAQFDLERLAEATEGFSGAEIEQAVISSLYRSIQNKQAPATDAIVEAIRSTVPLSISRREDVARIRAIATGRFTPVA